MKIEITEEEIKLLENTLALLENFDVVLKTHIDKEINNIKNIIEKCNKAK